MCKNIVTRKFHKINANCGIYILLQWNNSPCPPPIFQLTQPPFLYSYFKLLELDLMKQKS